MGQLFDPRTGEVSGEGDCPACADSLRRAIEAERDTQRVEKDLRDERRHVASLKAELDKQQRQSPNIVAAEALFRYWVARLDKNPRKVVFGEKRRKVVLARLNEHDPEYIARAIDGLAETFYTSTNGKRFDDIELVCRDEVKLEGCYEAAERASAPTLIGPAWVHEFGGIVDPT